MKISFRKIRVPDFSLTKVYSSADYVRLSVVLVPLIALCCWLTGISPRFLLSSRRLESGISTGLFLAIGIICAHRIALSFKNLSYNYSVEIYRQALRKTPWPALVSRLIVAIGIEEPLRLLFLSYDFGLSRPILLTIHAGLVFLVYFRGFEHLIWTGISVFQGAALALIFLNTHSFSNLVIARFISDLLVLMVMYSERCWQLFLAPEKRTTAAWQTLFPKLSLNFPSSILKRKKIS